MLNMNRKLLKWEAEGKEIKVGVVGAGQMGRGMVVEMVKMHGIKPVVLSDIVLENAINAYRKAGVADDDIAVHPAAAAGAAVEAGKLLCIIEG